MNLNKQQTATVLAALRYWQHNVIRHQIEPTDIPYEYHDHFTDDKPLTRDEIDALCEAINFDGEEPKVYVMVSDDDGNIESPLTATDLEDALQEALATLRYAVLTREEAEKDLGDEEEEGD